MENTVNWSSNELYAYILIYCMNADYIESGEEVKLIKDKIDNNDVYLKMHNEFEADNDYQSIQKISYSAKKLGYSKEKVTTLVDDIKALFLSDGNFNAVEKTLLFGLKKILF